MIRINLLPPEFRVKERTPLPMLLGILGGVIFCILILLVFLYCHIVWLPQVDGRLKERQKEKVSRTRKAQEYDKLKADEAKYTGVDRLVKQIESQRENWAIYLKDLVEIMAAAEKENENFQMWISDLRFEAEKDKGRGKGKEKLGGKISFDFEIAGSDMGLYDDFLKELKKEVPDRTLYKNLLRESPPNMRISPYDDYIPNKAVQFQKFEIFFKSKAKKKAPKPAPKKPQPKKK